MSGPDVQDREVQQQVRPVEHVDGDGEPARVRAERDEYLDALRRVQADFENYRKRMIRQQTDHVERAGQSLVSQLLPALDALELAGRHHPEVVGPLWSALWSVLMAEGVERVDPAGYPFDPNYHDAVDREGTGDGGRPVVVEVLRPGYRYRGRLLRPAMVKVSG